MIVALDFDGVIMDGINECMLVAWNVYNKKPLSDFNNKVFNEIPQSFIDTFIHFRNFVRHDGHFIVPFYFNRNQLVDNYVFNLEFEKISENEKEMFRNSFVYYRTNVKKFFPEYWISLHKELISLSDIINLDIDVRIVSGKDSESILFLLKNKGIEIDPHKVHGRMTDKNEVLISMRDEADGKGESFVFIDDNLSNVNDANNLGVCSLWAFWGFHTLAHVNDAKRLSVRAIDKEELISFIQYSKEREK